MKSVWWWQGPKARAITLIHYVRNENKTLCNKPIPKDANIVKFGNDLAECQICLSKAERGKV